MVRSFVRVLVALVVVWLGVGLASAVHAAPTTSTVAVYNCDAPDHDQSAANVTSECSQPTIYDQPAQFAQVDNTAGMTAGLAAAIDSDLSGLQLGGVAAKSADEVADIGHAGIHQFPGTLPRKSQFFDGVDLGSLSSRTKGIDGIVQTNGNARYVLRNPGGAGVDRTTGLPTDVYTVIRGPDSSVVTMFPGTSPKG